MNRHPSPPEGGSTHSGRAFGVRMFMLRRGATPAHAAGGALAAESADPFESADVDPAEEATVLHTDFGGVHRAA